MSNLNTNRDMWQSDDGLEEYRDKAIESSVGGILGTMKEYSDIGGEIGGAFGPLGKAAGKVVGGVVGLVKGLWDSIFW